MDRREIQRQENRHPPRQVGLRERPGFGGEGQAQRRRRDRGHVRGHQSGREGLYRGHHQAEERRGGVRLFRRLSRRGRPHSAPGGRPGRQVPAHDRRQHRDVRVLGDVRARRARARCSPSRPIPDVRRARPRRWSNSRPRDTTPRALPCSATASFRRSPMASSGRGRTIRRRSPRRSRMANRSTP